MSLNMPNVDRQTAMVLLLAGCVAVALYTWVVQPLYRSTAALEKRIPDAMVQLEEVRALARQAKGAPRAAAVLPGQEQTLFSKLESVSAARKLTDKIVFMRPSQRQSADGQPTEVVQMRLKEVPLAKLVDFLAEMESRWGNVVTEQLQVRAHDSKPPDVDLVFAASGQGGR